MRGPLAGAPFPPSAGHRRLLIVAAAFVAACAAGLLLFTSPTLGAALVTTLKLVFACAIAVGPYVHRSLHGPAWPLISLAGVFWGVAAVLPVPDAASILPSASELVFWTGSVFVALWLARLCLVTNSDSDVHIAIDVALTMIGAFLTLWTWYLFTLSEGPGLLTALPWAAPPILDILILTLVGHLIRRLPRMEAPHVWLVVVPVMMLSANTVVAVLHAQAPGIDTTPVQIPLLFTYFVTAVMMCDPRMGLGVQLAIPPRERPSLREDNALIVLSTVPAITAAARPLAGDLDGLVRGVSVGLLVGLLIIRLWLTLRALKKSEARSAHRAAHDPLTSLFNRSALLDRLECLLESNRAQKKATVVVFLDCDRFKHINDTWGHHVGDELLRLVAQRLTNRLQEGEVVARQGGDEFVVLATVETYAEVVDLGERVRAAFIDPFSIVADELHTVTSSVGIAVASPDVAMTVDGILVAADTAMYEAKSRGPGHCVIADSHLDTCTATADAFVDPTMARPEPA